jgi:peroxisomal 2,4-dienoyl-CoA reductase
VLLIAQVVFVSGGATGIGFGIATAFGKLGAKVAVMGRKLHSLEEAAKKFEANGITALALQGDVRKPDTIEKALAEVVAKFGRLDVLVNNAAGNFMCSAEDMSTNAFQTVIEIDLQVCGLPFFFSLVYFILFLF